MSCAHAVSWSCATQGARRYSEGMEQDTTPTRPLNAAERFAELVGLPRPAAFTPAEEATYQEWMADGDARLAASIARRTSPAA